jgi:hypothetical protein
LPRIAIRKKTGLDFWTWGKGDRFICSEGVARYYVDRFSDTFKGVECLTPGDFDRIECGLLKKIVI